MSIPFHGRTWIIAVDANEGGFAVVAPGNPNCVAFDVLRAGIYKMSHVCRATRRRAARRLDLRKFLKRTRQGGSATFAFAFAHDLAMLVE